MVKSKNIFKGIKWGSLTKQMKDYNKKNKTNFDLTQFSHYILENPDKFKKTTEKRANFYLNVLHPHVKGGKVSVGNLKRFIDNSYSSNPEENINGYILDKDLSTDEGKVYYNPELNHATLTHRGTEGTLRDWSNNLKYGLSSDLYKNTDRFKRAKQLQEATEKKYGTQNVSTLGHSQGSILSRELGQNSKEIINLNPASKGESSKANEYNIKASNDVVSKLKIPDSKTTVIKSGWISNPLTEHSTAILNRLDQNKMIGQGIEGGANFDFTGVKITVPKTEIEKLTVYQIKQIIEQINQKYLDEGKPDDVIKKYKSMKKKDLVKILEKLKVKPKDYKIETSKAPVGQYKEADQESYLLNLSQNPRYSNPLQALQKYTTKEGTQEYISLQDHQSKFIKQFIFSNLRGAIAYHGVGSGKTLTAVVCSYYYLKMYPKNRVIVISPSALLFNFINGMIQYGLDIKDNRFKYYTYEKYVRNPILAKDALLIVDEAHNFRSPIIEKEETDPETGEVIEVNIKGNRRGQKLMKFGSDYAHKVLLLTGTAFVNNLYDIENLISMVDKRKPITPSDYYSMLSNPDNLGDYFSYKISYYATSPKSIYFPERREVLLPIYMDSEFLQKYNDIEKSDKVLVGYAEEHFKNKKANEKGEYGLNAYYNGVLNASNSIDGINNPKIKYIVDLIKNSTQKFIIYSTLYDAGVQLLVDRMSKENIKTRQITGRQSSSQKEESKMYFNGYNFKNDNFFNLDTIDERLKKFINDEYRVLVITKAGAEGVDTINCQNIILLDSQWNDATSEQIIARAIRYKSHFGLPEKERYVNVIRTLLLKPTDKPTYEKIKSPEFKDWTFIKKEFEGEKKVMNLLNEEKNYTPELYLVDKLPNFNKAHYKELSKEEKPTYRSKVFREYNLYKNATYQIPSNWKEIYDNLKKPIRRMRHKSLPPPPIPTIGEVDKLPNFEKEVYDKLNNEQKELYRYNVKSKYDHARDNLGKKSTSSVISGLTKPAVDLYLLILAKAKTKNIDEFISLLGNDISLFESYQSKLLPYIVEKEKKLKRKLTDEEQAKIYAELLNNEAQVILKAKYEIDPETILKKKLDTRTKEEKLQQYFTGEKLTDEIISNSSIKSKQGKITVLEPTAGWGNLIKPLLKFKKDITIDMVEYDQSNREVLKKLVDEAKNILKLMDQKDFLLFTPSNRYDYIFTNPPFHLRKGEIPHLLRDVWDYNFVMRAYACLKVGGELIAITGQHWKKDNQFIQWADSVGWVHYDKEGEKFYHAGNLVKPPITIMKFTKKTDEYDNKIFGIQFYNLDTKEKGHQLEENTTSLFTPLQPISEAIKKEENIVENIIEEAPKKKTIKIKKNKSTVPIQEVEKELEKPAEKKNIKIEIKKKEPSIQELEKELEESINTPPKPPKTQQEIDFEKNKDLNDFLMSKTPAELQKMMADLLRVKIPTSTGKYWMISQIMTLYVYKNKLKPEQIYNYFGVKQGKGISNPKLYEKAKKIADEKYKKNSAYKSGFIQKCYKDMGGTYTDDNNEKPLKRWFKEDWKDVGNKDYPVYRPTKRINKKTPLTIDEIDPQNLKSQIELKQKIKGNKNLPPFKSQLKLMTSHFQNLPKPIFYKLKDIIEEHQLSGGGDFFGNIGKAFKTSWNKPVQSKAEGDALKFFYNDFLPIATTPIKVLAPPVGQISDIGFNKLRQHQNI